MADLLQRVFMIFVRPYYIDQYGHKIHHTGAIYVPENGSYKPLTTNNAVGSSISPVKLNASALFSADPWMLHSVYTSYNEFRDKLKEVMAVYGTDNIKCANYIPVDYDILPRE